MGPRRRTPQEKKRLSLERDTPLSAKYPKAFRKQWPRTKATAERALRHAQHRALAAGNEDAGVERKVVRKWPQPRLAEVIAGKARRRAKLQRAPRKAAATRARRARKRRRIQGLMADQKRGHRSAAAL
jgi:hypothetical protein